MRFSRFVVSAAGSLLLVSLAAYPTEAPDADLKTAAVAVFKNGLAFVLRQGDVRLESGSGRISPVPGATLGTLWIAPNDPGASLDEVVAYHYKVSGKRSLTALAEVLLENAGKTVTVETNDQKEFTGEIVGLPQSELPSPELPPAAFSTSVQPAAYAIAPAARTIPEFLLLKSGDKLTALQLSSVYRVNLPANTILQAMQEEDRRALRFKIKGAGSHANMTMGYLEHGLGWTPSYLVSLQDDKTAQITMQAVVTDDAEDLRNTDVFFVVGVPNFAFSATPSPMALQQSLLEFMQAAGRRDALGGAGLAGGVFSNAITGQMTADEYDAGRAANLGTTVEELSGAPEEDLFLYTRSGVTLARGERATYNVFSGPVNFEHIYEWEVFDQPRVDGFGNVQNYSGQPPRDSNAVNNIWHSIRLTNSTKFPWTSAPAMVVSGAKPLAQDTLPYTPKQANSNLKLTIATDIRSSHEEREVARVQNVQRRHGYDYDQVTVEGTLKVKNYKTKAVSLSIGKTIRGAVESQTDEGKAVKLGEAIQTDNPVSRMTWELTLKPGEERTVTYRYKIWLRV